MSDSDESILYRKGEDPQLDQKYEEYLRMRVWRGNAMDELFSEDEFQTLLKLWRKETLLPAKLNVEDVSRLVEFAGRIRAYRAAKEREKCRQRMERARKKLQMAAEKGDSEAIKKIESRKKSARKFSAEYYKRKRHKKHRSS